MPASESAGSQDLRRSLRDLVALTMLPTVWARYQPAQICADLVDVIARMIDADGVYLTSPANGCGELLWLRSEEDQEAARLLRETGNALGASADAAGAGNSALRLLAGRGDAPAPQLCAGEYFVRRLGHGRARHDVHPERRALRVC